MALIDELKRRKVFKVGGAYLVVAWLAVQAVSIGFPAFDAPPWALRVFILMAMLGFPIALVFAWMFDMTPDGVFDMGGSMREIMRDRFRPYDEGCWVAHGIAVNPVCDDAELSTTSLRGGSVVRDSVWLLSALRHQMTLGELGAGFRCAYEVPQ